MKAHELIDLLERFDPNREILLIEPLMGDWVHAFFVKVSPYSSPYKNPNMDDVPIVLEGTSNIDEHFSCCDFHPDSNIRNPIKEDCWDRFPKNNAEENMSEDETMKYDFSKDGIMFTAEVEGTENVERCNKVHENFDNLYDWVKMMKAAGAEITVE